VEHGVVVHWPPAVDTLGCRYPAQVGRSERYKRRNQEQGYEVENDSVLPGFMDPITLEPVVNPGLSPYGHVMGMATWAAVLSDASVRALDRLPSLTSQHTPLLTTAVWKKNDLKNVAAALGTNAYL
jgi:hypothetical protein